MLQNFLSYYRISKAVANRLKLSNSLEDTKLELTHSRERERETEKTQPDTHTRTLAHTLEWGTREAASCNKWHNVSHLASRTQQSSREQERHEMNSRRNCQGESQVVLSSCSIIARKAQSGQKTSFSQCGTEGRRQRAAGIAGAATSATATATATAPTLSGNVTRTQSTHQSK